jgi:hypothetical protein
MRKAVRTTTTIIFLAVVLGCAFAVLYLGTSTGLTFGGASAQLTQTSKSEAVYAQTGWLRNTAPWPVTIDSITANETNATAEPTVYLERAQSGSKVSSDTKLPNWALNAQHPPYQLDGGSLRYLGFSFSPTKDQVAYMTSITVHFTGPLGMHFTSTFKGTTVAAASSTLPAGVLGQDPTVDSSSLDAYVAALRSTLLSQSAPDAALVMGGGATTAEAQIFLTAHPGYVTSDAVIATPDPSNRRLQKVVFYLGDPTKNALVPISVKWTGYRWTVVRG